MLWIDDRGYDSNKWSQWIFTEGSSLEWILLSHCNWSEKTKLIARRKHAETITWEGTQ